MAMAGTSDHLTIHCRHNHGYRPGLGEIRERSTGRHRRGLSWALIGSGQDARDLVAIVVKQYDISKCKNGTEAILDNVCVTDSKEDLIG